jgi:hypothetical protein
MFFVKISSKITANSSHHRYRIFLCCRTKSLQQWSFGMMFIRILNGEWWRAFAALFFKSLRDKALDEMIKKRLNMTRDDVINLFAHKIFFMDRKRKDKRRKKRKECRKRFFLSRDFFHFNVSHVSHIWDSLRL